MTLHTFCNKYFSKYYSILKGERMENKPVSANKQKKMEKVQILSQTVQSAKSIVFTDFRGLKHKQLEELRRELKKVNGKIEVTKNTLLLRSLGSSGESVKSLLNNTTATLYAFEDEIAPIKAIVKFFKTAGAGSVKGGLLGTTVLSSADVDKLSKLPSRIELLSKLVGQLNAPIQGLHYALSWNMNRLVWVLNSIKNKK
jgi:large subunit ribosomal protein L10